MNPELNFSNVRCRARLLLLAFVALIAVLTSEHVHSAAVTWDGGGADGDWSTATNWAGNAAPNGNDDLIFSGTVRLNNTNDLTGGALTNNFIEFSAGAGSFVLNGNALTLDETPMITVSSTNTQTINLNVAMGITGAWATASGNLVMNGVVSSTGNFGLTKSGAATLFLNNANTYSNATTISAGALRIANSSALGTTGTGTTIAAAGTLQLTTNSSGQGLTVAEAITNSGTIRNIAGTNTISGLVTLGGAATNISDAGTLIFNRAGASISGTADALTFGGAGNIEVQTTFSNTTGTLTKIGAGTLTLSASNNFTNTTTLTAGTLRATTSTSALGSGTLSLGGGLLELAGDSGLNFGRNTTVTGNTQINSERLANGVGVTHTLGTLSIGAQTLTIGSDSTTTSGTAGITFGTVTLSATGAVFNVNTNNAQLTLGAVSGNTFGFTVGGAGNTTISGVVGTTTGTVSKTGAGTLTMSSAANTYGGVTTIGGGALTVGTLANAGANSSIGTNATIAISNAGKLHYTGGTVAINRGVNLSGGNGDINVSNSAAALTISGVISNSGTLVKSGAGTLILAASNSYQGGTLLNSGTLAAGNAFAFGSGSVTVGAGTTLNLSNLSIANTLINNGGTLTNLGTVSGAELNGGTTTIASSNSTVAEVSGTAQVTVSGVNTTITNLTGGALNVTGTNTTIQSFTGGSISNATSVTVQAGASSGTISGAGRLIKNGEGTLTLSGANTYEGSTTISNGTLQVGDGGTTGTLGAGSVTNNATLVFNRSDSISVGNIISGTGSVVKQGAATLTLGGENSFSGGLSILGGAVSVAQEGFLGAASNAITLDNGKLVTTATVDLGPDRSVTFGAGGGTIEVATGTTATVDGLLSGSGSFTKIGAGTIALDAASAGYAGASFINQGTLRLNNENVLAASEVTVAEGATLVAAFGNATLGNLGGAGNVVIASNAVVGSLNNNAVLSGTVSGNGSLTKTGGGTLTLAANNSHAGGVFLDGNGAVRVQSAGAFGTGFVTQASGSSTIIIDTTGTITNQMDIYNVAVLQSVTMTGAKELFNATYNVTNNTTTTESGTLSGGGGITKLGTGTLIVTASNTFTGAVDVQAGVLNLNSSTGFAAGSTTNVSVASGATLLVSQSGQVNNAATVSLTGGTISRGSGVSEVFGNLTVTGSSFLDFGTGAIGTLSFGTYTPSSLLTVNNFLPGNVLTFGSDLSSTINNSSFFSFDGDFTSGFNSGNSTFTITAIPEPSTYLAAAGLLALMLWPSRRRLIAGLRGCLGAR